MREDGLAPIAQALGLAIPLDALDRLAPAVRKMYADLERLRELPIDGLTPALPRLARASGGRETAR